MQLKCARLGVNSVNHHKHKTFPETYNLLITQINSVNSLVHPLCSDRLLPGASVMFHHRLQTAPRWDQQVSNGEPRPSEVRCFSCTWLGSRIDRLSMLYMFIVMVNVYSLQCKSEILQNRKEPVTPVQLAAARFLTAQGIAARNRAWLLASPVYEAQTPDQSWGRSKVFDSVAPGWGP